MKRSVTWIDTYRVKVFTVFTLLIINNLSVYINVTGNATSHYTSPFSKHIFDRESSLWTIYIP